MTRRRRDASNGRKTVTIGNFPITLWKAVKVEATVRDMDLKDAVIEALTAWLPSLEGPTLKARGGSPG